MPNVLLFVSRQAQPDLGEHGFIDGVIGVILNLTDDGWPTEEAVKDAAVLMLNNEKNAQNSTGENLSGANQPAVFNRSYLNAPIIELAAGYTESDIPLTQGIIVRDVRFGGISDIQPTID